MENSELKAEVSWHAEDIQDLRPNWTIDQCNEFLEDIERGLQEHMIEKGWEYVRWELADHDEPDWDNRDHLLKPYFVTLHETPGEKFITRFDCQAEDAEHAYEQAENAYPGCELLCAVLDEQIDADDGCPTDSLDPNRV